MFLVIMKKSGSVLDMLKMQVKDVKCPACGVFVSKIKLNEHLDTNCPSHIKLSDICSKDYCERDFEEQNPSMKYTSIRRFKADYSNKSNISKQYFEIDSSCEVPDSKLKLFISAEKDSTEKPEIPHKLAVGVMSYSSTSVENKNYPLKDENSSNLKLNPEISGNDQNLQTIVEGNSKLSINSKTFVLEDHETNSKNNIINTNKDQSYYLVNFKHILHSVFMDHNNSRLFNDEDMAYVNIFHCLSETSQKLYVRLFQRKYKWLRSNKIIYPEIAKDSSLILEELVHKKLIISGSEEINLETALNMLSLLEVKNIGKFFKYNVTRKNKQEIISLLLKHGQQHKSVLISSRVKVSEAMLKRVMQTIGSCYKLALEPKRIFTRILMLFSLPNIAEDEDESCGGQQQQLLTLLLINKGQLTYPEYLMERSAVIFQDRDDLIRFEEAKQLENEITSSIEAKNFKMAKKLYITSVKEYEMLCEGNFEKRDSLLPSFLRRFSASHVYIRSMSHGVEILQKLREYEEAVKLLKNLLSQKVYCHDYRGQWWDRMALNLEQHLKQPREALEMIKQALHDDYVRGGYRFSLLSRAQRIIRSIKDDEMFVKEISEAAGVVEAPRVIIKGCLFPRSLPGRKHVFISSIPNSTTDDDDITVLAVEDLALEHYKREGYIEGIHGESSTFISIYALLFWNIIYNGDIPDVFISPYQGHPLDLNSDNFFCSRKDRILSHLEYLRNATSEVIQNLIKTTWENQFGKVSLVKWDNFTGFEQIGTLVHCLGNVVVAGICERLAKDFRFSRSGVPDLVVWNPLKGCVKVVEVKGPSDRLSCKQVLWLDYLLTIGVEAEVCLVEAVGSKKLKRN